jgi:hypothetical protein
MPSDQYVYIRKRGNDPVFEDKDGNKITAKFLFGRKNKLGFRSEAGAFRIKFTDDVPVENWPNGERSSVQIGPRDEIKPEKINPNFDKTFPFVGFMTPSNQPVLDPDVQIVDEVPDRRLLKVALGAGIFVAGVLTGKKLADRR